MPNLPHVPPPTVGHEVWSIRILMALIVLAGLAGLGMLISAALSAALGLVALSAIGLGSIAFFQALPMIGQRWENRLLAARKAEARRNPIEQLEGFYLQKAGQVEAFRRQMATMGGQIRSMRDLVAERKRSKPSYDASRLEASITQMATFYETRMRKLGDAQAALGKVAELLEEKKFEHQFATAGSAAMRSLDGNSDNALLDSLLADEALQSVRDTFNQVFAELEVEARSLKLESTEIDASQLNDLQQPVTLNPPKAITAKASTSAMPKVKRR